MLKFSPGIRDKLISIFVLIKVVPLIVLAWFAWHQMSGLADKLKLQLSEIATESHDVVGQVAALSAENSINALDAKSKESIERLTENTSRTLAAFLYSRDNDIKFAATLTPNKTNYEHFLKNRMRQVCLNAPWFYDAKTDSWRPSPKPAKETRMIRARNIDNSRDFHYRPPSATGRFENRPLYLEMTYVALDGHEKVKATDSKLMYSGMRDISRKENTYCKAETYFQDLKKLKPGEIYVSEVIGPYVRGQMIGVYNKAKADKIGIVFNPKESGYAGKENPVGKRFHGIIRWAAPVVRKGKVQGYVTLALDHTHVMEFTDHIVPTKKRFSPISDASTGNYAFMWDYKDRCISHPRDYFIAGYDPETGEPATPWLSRNMFDSWKKSNISIKKFLETAPQFKKQSLKKKPAEELTRTGLVGLDGRFLNFAPQCEGWHNITQNGGSGSFLIFWSGLWKLTTAAAIPYYTGRYGKNPRGFGYVTIGANVNEFHKPAMQNARDIKEIEHEYIINLEKRDRINHKLMGISLKKTAKELTVYTMLMVVIVILIAIWIASTLTGRITDLIRGIGRFQEGDMGHRLVKKSRDEMGQLSDAFNHMADSVQQSIEEISEAKESAEKANLLLQTENIQRQKAEKELARHRDNLEEIVRERTIELEKEIAERKKAEATLLEGDERLRKHNKALLNLAGHDSLYAGNLQKALKIIMESLARTLGVMRTSIWLFDKNFSKLACSEFFAHEDEGLSKDALLLASDYPAFFESMTSKRILPINAPSSDPRTEQFIEKGPLSPKPGSLLIAMVNVGGQTKGAVFIENFGKLRQWRLDEQNFAGSAADIVSLAIEASERRQSEKAKKALEQRLHQAEKMEAIGTLAGGVAHDLNNILSGIVSYPELLLMKLPEDSPMKHPIETILASGKRASAIVEDLLTLARRGVTITEVVNLNDIILDYLKSPEHEKLLSFHPDIEIETFLEPDLLNMSGSPIHLSKTIMNLLSNAAESMPGGGKITITTENCYIDRPIKGYDKVKEGDYVTLRVDDSGTGISPEDMGRIFEPFYTKKKMGRSGTGLGMAVVWGTIKDHKGYIDFKSKLQDGTSFTLYFPVCRKEMDAGRESLPVATYMGKGESVLVVDDIKEQREIASMILTQLGYKVTTASSGEDAIEYMKNNKVDLLVLDMIMEPGMDGLDTYKKIIEIHPGQKAIIASGFSETDRVKKAQKLGAGQYIKKPYSIEKFGLAVKQGSNLYS